MSRSVNYLDYADHVAYIDASGIEHDYEWDDFTDELESRLTDLFPSLETASEWDNNETRIILENHHAVIGLSEYCGLVSVSIRHKDDDEQVGLHKHWVDSIESKFLSIGELKKVGTFSNGEAVFERATA